MAKDCEWCAEPATEKRVERNRLAGKASIRHFCKGHVALHDQAQGRWRDVEDRVIGRSEAAVGVMSHNNHVLLISEGEVDACGGCKRLMRVWPFGKSSRGSLVKAGKRLVAHMNREHGKEWVLADQVQEKWGSGDLTLRVYDASLL